MPLIDPATVKLVSAALDAATLRHAAIAQNVANANVAGARASRVEFESQLQSQREALQAGQPLDLQALQQLPEARMSWAPANESISLDEQLGSLSSNAVHYQALLKALDRHLGLMSLAIHEGRR